MIITKTWTNERKLTDTQILFKNEEVSPLFSISEERQRNAMKVDHLSWARIYISECVCLTKRHIWIVTAPAKVLIQFSSSPILYIAKMLTPILICAIIGISIARAYKFMYSKPDNFPPGNYGRYIVIKPVDIGHLYFHSHKLFPKVRLVYRTSVII